MGKNRAHACDRVLSVALHPWAITRPMLQVVAHVLSHRLAGDALDVSTLERQQSIGPATQGGVAIIPIHGVIAPRMNALSDISGGATFESASLALAEAAAAPEVGTIVLDIDSPGGSVLGATEFAREVMAARTKKRIVAHANFEMCSAAYWIGACATEVVASPSSMVGSIGVYSIHEDLSKLLDDMGVKLTYISAGKYKVDGNEAEPLSDTARARLTALVNAAYGRFVGDVAKGRGRTDQEIRNGYGEGTVVTADEALSLGMVDRIATFDETLARLLPSGRTVTTRAEVQPVVTTLDTPQEPAKATGQDRAREHRAIERALIQLGL